jgi:hypothetical protein
LPNIGNSTRVEIALARNTYQWLKELSGACREFVVPPCKLWQLPKGASFAACDKSCVALQRHDRSAKQICIVQSAMHAALGRLRNRHSFGGDKLGLAPIRQQLPQLAAASKATQRSIHHGWHLLRQEALAQRTGTSLKRTATFSAARS